MQDKELGWFLDRLVHDLREPLRSVGAFAEALAENMDQAPTERAAAEERHLLNEILDGSRRIRILVDGLSRYSIALDAPAMGEKSSLQLAVDLAIGELDQEIQASGARVEVQGKLPSLSIRLERLTQLMAILISNAIRFRSAHSPAVHISAQPTAEGDWIVTVADNGIGIAAEDREKIFLPFVRIHGRKYPGAGLGLAIARQIVCTHGGSISLQSEEHKGSAFSLTLRDE